MLLKLIEDIRDAKGTNAKARLLANISEDAEKMLNYALNPFFVYHTKAVTIRKASTGTETIGEKTFGILDDLRNNKISGNAAKYVLDKHISELRPRDAQVFSMMLERKLRFGIGIKTINKYLDKKIPTHETKLASKIDFSTVKFPIWASPKLDGMRAEARDGVMLSRKGKQIIGQQHILSKVDPSVPLDGELMIPGLPFEESLGLLRSFADNPKAVLYVFDTPQPNIRFEERMEIIEELKGKYKNVKILKHKLVNNLEELMDYYEKCRSLGLEGVVTKRPGHLFTPGRNKDWCKIKAVNSVELPIVGFEEGKGKYEGTLGAVIVRLENGSTVNVGTGFSDIDRHSFWNNQECFINKTMEVQYHERTLADSLRHPRYMRMRPDKDS